MGTPTFGTAVCVHIQREVHIYVSYWDGLPSLDFHVDPLYHDMRNWSVCVSNIIELVHPKHIIIYYKTLAKFDLLRES